MTKDKVTAEKLLKQRSRIATLRLSINHYETLFKIASCKGKKEIAYCYDRFAFVKREAWMNAMLLHMADYTRHLVRGISKGGSNV